MLRSLVNVSASMHALTFPAFDTCRMPDHDFDFLCRRSVAVALPIQSGLLLCCASIRTITWLLRVFSGALGLPETRLQWPSFADLDCTECADSSFLAVVGSALSSFPQAHVDDRNGWSSREARPIVSCLHLGACADAHAYSALLASCFALVCTIKTVDEASIQNFLRFSIEINNCSVRQKRIGSHNVLRLDLPLRIAPYSGNHRVCICPRPWVTLLPSNQ
jgi:hypothetical protein